MKKEHGEHNHKLCLELLIKHEYDDWVVTTAFYSAIHFIDYKLFCEPLEYGEKIFNDISEAHRYLKKPSRHETRRELVKMKLNPIISKYNFLEDICKNARYIDYRIDKNIAIKAKDFLEAIKQFCCS